MKRSFAGNRRGIGVSALAASIAIAYPLQSYALDFVWFSGNYSSTGFASTVSASDRLFAETTSTKSFDIPTFVNFGSVIQNGASLQVSGPTSVSNNGTWHFQGDVGLTGGSGNTFTNNGTLSKVSGSGTSTIASGVPLINNGILDAQSGIIEYDSVATFNSGTSFTGAGRHVITRIATFTGDFNFNNNLQFAGSTITATPANGVTLNSNLLWTSGRLAGRWINGSNSTLTANGLTGASKDFAGTFVNNGTVLQADDPLRLTGSDVTNNGTWHFQGDVGLTGGSGNTFTNNGTLSKVSGSGTSTIASGVPLINNGILDAQSGIIEYDSVATFNSGTSFTGAGRHVITRIATFTGDFNFNNNLQFAGSTITATPANGVTLNSNLLWTSGALAGRWINGSNSTLTASGLTGTSKDFAGTFVNNGTVLQADDPLRLTGAGVTNNGTWRFQGDVGLTGSGGTSFTNNGTLSKVSGIGTSTIDTNIDFVNNGLVDVQTGTVAVRHNFANDGTVRVAAGTVFDVATSSAFINRGTLTGAGTIDAPTAGLINAGVIDPGLGVGSLSILGDLTQQSAGIVNIDLASLASFDRLLLSGTAALGGTLRVTNAGISGLSVGDSFIVMTFGGHGATEFANLNEVGFSGLTFEVLYNAGDVTLRVAAVPEPSEWMMMLAGLAALGMVARRRSRGAGA